MKKTISLVLIILSTISVNAAVYHFKITNAQSKSKVSIILNDTGLKSTTELDDKGCGTITLNNFKTQYATLKVGYIENTIYLNPSDDMAISLDVKRYNDKVDFIGKGGKINSYLCSKQIHDLAYKYTKLEEKKFLQTADSLYKSNMKVLNVANLCKEFTNKEILRLKYLTYKPLANYPSYYKYFSKNDSYQPSEAYYDLYKSLAVFKSDLLIYPEYKFFISRVVSESSKENIEKNQISKVGKNLEYIEKNVTDPKVVEYLVNSFVYPTIEVEGINRTGNLIEAFRKYVKDPNLVKQLDDLIALWSKIKPGVQSPSFSYYDIDGKLVSLNDLKGKYVYIDIWATWCGPCCHQLPYMKKLEEKYNGKDIYFVSISCDKDKKAWEAKVKKDQLKGIQLNNDNDRDFMDKYMAHFIPRFILLDKEGKIIDSKMSSPSEKETTETLDSLLK